MQGKSEIFKTNPSAENLGMENVITLIAALGGAMIGGGFAFVTALAIQKRQEKEKYFYEFYTKRIDLYKKLMMFMSEVAETTTDEKPKSIEEAYRNISLRFMNKAHALYVDCYIFASEEVREACSIFFQFVFDFFHGKVDCQLSDINIRFKEEFSIVTTAIFAETPAEKLDDFVKKITKTKDSCTQNHSNKKSN